MPSGWRWAQALVVAGRTDGLVTPTEPVRLGAELPPASPLRPSTPSTAAPTMTARAARRATGRRVTGPPGPVDGDGPAPDALGRACAVAFGRACDARPLPAHVSRLSRT